MVGQGSWLEPVGVVSGADAAALVAAGRAVSLWQGPLAFSALRLFEGTEARLVPWDADLPPALDSLRARLLARPEPWAGFAATDPFVMGILNCTPDSFSDGGRHLDPEAAIRAGLAMAEAGAAIIDVGGESTRPGSEEVPPEEEMRRILPVIRELAARGLTLSVDTRHAVTMEAALEAGARIINDVSGLTFDPAARAVSARRGAPVVLMHMRGTPATMKGLAQYRDVAREVTAELGAVFDAALAAGIAPAQVALDPGFGFAKEGRQNLELMQRLPILAAFGRPLLIGVSRKRLIGLSSGEGDAARRMPGSIAAALHALARGASLLRVHDVAETVQAVRVWRDLLAPPTPLSPHPAR